MLGWCCSTCHLPSRAALRRCYSHTNFSISAGIGFIALFDIYIQDGVILITVFKQNILKKMPLDSAT